MRIVLLTPELLSFGGIQRQTRLLVSALDELLSESSGNLEVLSLNDRPPKVIPPELAFLHVTSIIYFSGSRPEFMRQFLAKSRRADMVIYGLLGFTLMSFVQQFSLNPCRRLLMLHGIEAWDRRSWLHSLAVRTMHGYLSVSQYTLDKFYKAYGIRSGKFSLIIPNVLSPTLTPKCCLHAKLGTRTSSTLLTVSGMRSHDQPKGIDTVLRSLPHLVSQFSYLRYSVVGDGPDRRRLELLAAELGVDGNVDFLGNVTDAELKDLYDSCDIFVLPSAKEGFGLVYVEAMAYGKPIVAAWAGATPEVVQNQETGILVEYDNDIQLADALADLLNDPDRCRKMGEAGVRTAETRFSYQALKSNLRKILYT